MNNSREMIEFKKFNKETAMICLMLLGVALLGYGMGAYTTYKLANHDAEQYVHDFMQNHICTHIIQEDDFYGNIDKYFIGNKSNT